ncbi:hypothetical protein MHZ92_10480 [Sporosarcina sp. ACRSL]|uniref:DUF6583 family protein n=1 Tax=Sporosarcina sp. ACRSL TaxID=2918215 RepID=UPI001EF65408|nr:DUF6583 family protein [Sporosarcina sp. ACRSL]MCG7344563.1 hypothetical protein [Sporosarcina sp. ACRSL]
MDGVQETIGKRKSPALLIALLTVVVLIGAGSVSAFFLLNKSPKVKYLLAETKTFAQIGDLFEERYKNEVDWMDVQKTKPVETSFDLSAEWNDPSASYDMVELQRIVNNTTLSMKQVKDPVEKEWEINFSGAFGSISSDFVTFYITPERFMAALPFTDKLLYFMDEDYGKLMRETDSFYEGPDKLGLSHLFEEQFAMTGEFQTYVKEEYMEYLYHELPEEAFTSEKEEIDLFGEKINTEKVEMNLSEEQVKTLLVNLFKKARTDEKLKALLKEQIAFSTMTDDISARQLTEMIRDFEDSLDEAIDGIESLHIPDGIKSTIWHKSNSIVKREFTMSMGEFEESIATFTFEGVQLLEKSGQKWDYSFTGMDPHSGEDAVLNFKGDLTWKDGKSDDTITISAEDTVITYKGKEELDGKERTFNREFSVSDDDFSPRLVWSGKATHEKDSMKSDNDFTIIDPSGAISSSDIYLRLKKEGKIVKKVEMPSESEKLVDVGNMSSRELDDLGNELAEEFEKWVTELMGDLQRELENF